MSSYRSNEPDDYSGLAEPYDKAQRVVNILPDKARYRMPVADIVRLLFKSRAPHFGYCLSHDAWVYDSPGESYRDVRNEEKHGELNQHCTIVGIPTYELDTFISNPRAYEALSKLLELNSIRGSARITEARRPYRAVAVEIVKNYDSRGQPIYERRPTKRLLREARHIEE
jgi:hypothetical protein